MTRPDLTCLTSLTSFTWSGPGMVESREAGTRCMREREWTGTAQADPDPMYLGPADYLRTLSESLTFWVLTAPTLYSHTRLSANVRGGGHILHMDIYYTTGVVEMLGGIKVLAQHTQRRGAQSYARPTGMPNAKVKGAAAMVTCMCGHGLVVPARTLRRCIRDRRTTSEDMCCACIRGS